MSVWTTKKETQYVMDSQENCSPRFLLYNSLEKVYDEVEPRKGGLNKLTLIKSDGTEIEYTLP